MEYAIFVSECKTYAQQYVTLSATSWLAHCPKLGLLKRVQFILFTTHLPYGTPSPTGTFEASTVQTSNGMNVELRNITSCERGCGMAFSLRGMFFYCSELLFEKAVGRKQ